MAKTDRSATLDRQTDDRQDEMAEKKRWTVVLDIDRCDGQAHAVARLYMGHTDRLVGEATVNLNPADREVPLVGDELVVAQALSHLSHQLLQAAAHDTACASPRRVQTALR